MDQEPFVGVSTKGVCGCVCNFVSWTEHVCSVQQEVPRAEKSKPTLYSPTGQPDDKQRGKRICFGVVVRHLLHAPEYPNISVVW
jgi:hypothetical protein